MRRGCLILFALQLFSAVFAYEKFQDAIPNGHNVPNPCACSSPGVPKLWGGVGHKAIAGGGDRNMFGLAFQAYNNAWTTENCQADSDGDGLTNGQELGDPKCVWKVGQNATYGPRGHPGICEPVGSVWCQNSWFKC